MAATSEPKPQRVLMTGDTVGGVWTFTLELAEALSAQGIEVVLAALGGQPTSAQAAEAARIRNLCLLGSSFKLEWMEDPWDDVAESGRWLLDIEREYKPDVVHLNSFGHGGMKWRAPTLLTAHSCVLSWWNAVKGEPAPASWDRYRFEVARSLRSVDLITAPSADMAAALKLHYGIEASACRVIPNSRSAAKFHRGTKEPFVFTAGRIWDPAKNVAAVARIAPSIPWPVYVAGDPQDARIDGCHLLGRLSDGEIASWYTRAAIYAMPARYEPFGLSILEAALSGCALVLGDIPSLRSIWGDCAVFVLPDDMDAMQQALETLIQNSGIREEMSNRACRRAMDFGVASMSREYLECYGRAIRSKQCVS